MIDANRQNEDVMDQEELVAYLDGELDPDSVRRVEDRLTSDSKYRSLLQQLERSWELLDELPQATVDESFTRTTLEMVAVRATEDIDQIDSKAPSKFNKRLAGTLVLGIVVGLASYFAIAAWLNQKNEQLLQDLPVIQRVDLYRNVDDIEFLEMLDEQNLFTGDPNDGDL